jgi:hypothetical protein
LKSGDFVILEYNTHKTKSKTRIFEVYRFNEIIKFENSHCNIYCKPNEKEIVDSDGICKNIRIKSIVTKEQFENAEYKFDN